MPGIRPNRVKRKLMKGEVATVLAGEMTPNLIETFASYGFDGVWIETEHGDIDYADITKFSRACDVSGVTSVVRVNNHLPGVIYRTLDVGAQGIVVPHVNTREEAHAVVSAAKFAPIGARGMYTSRQGIGVEDYFVKANDETLVVILIEDIVAVRNLADMLKVDHIDVFFVAPSDLAQSMGYLGRESDPVVQKTIDAALKQIVVAGRTAGAIVDKNTARHYADMGVRFMFTAWDPWVEAGSRSFLKTVSALKK